MRRWILLWAMLVTTGAVGCHLHVHLLTVDGAEATTMPADQRGMADYFTERLGRTEP